MIKDILDNLFFTIYIILNNKKQYKFLKKKIKNAEPRLKLPPFEHPVRSLVLQTQKYIPYPRHCSPGVLFFNMGFWVGVNSKNPPKSGLFKQKVGVYSRKTPKTRLFTVPGAQFKSGAAMTRIRYLNLAYWAQKISFII